MRPWAARAMAALLITGALGCHALIGPEGTCADMSECDEAQICSGGVCVLDDATACTQQTQEFVCGTMARCDAAGRCVAEDAIIALINTPLAGSDSERSRVQTMTLKMLERELSQEFSEFDGRKLVIEQLVGQGSAGGRLAAFTRARDLGADVVVVFDTDTLIEAQSFFKKTSTLILGQFSNDARFDTTEFEGARGAYALIPQPRADFAMWSKHLRDEEVCQRVAAVYVAGSSSADTVVFLDEQIERHGLTNSGSFILDPQGTPGPVVDRLTGSGADCAFLFTEIDEEPVNTVATFLTEWDRRFEAVPSEERMRWLFVSQARFDELRETLPGEAFDQLGRSIVVNYDVGQERGERVLSRLRAFDAIYRPEELPEGTPVKLDWPVIEQLSAFVSLSYDQGALAVLALYRALARAEGGPVRQGDVLEGFLAVNGGSPEPVACDSDSLGECFDGMLLGSEPTYAGASGGLEFGEDGRTITVDETMIFSLSDGNANLEVTHRYSQTDMARALATTTAPE